MLRLLAVYSLSALLCFGVLPGSAVGQAIGTVRLTLGAREADVLRDLERYYRVDRQNGVVWERGGPPFRVLGTIGFSQ
jgi:hypothetical protein